LVIAVKGRAGIDIKRQEHMGWEVTVLGYYKENTIKTGEKGEYDMKANVKDGDWDDEREMVGGKRRQKQPVPDRL
jgi:hypothetical protein